ncbi:MAG: hypothetical protein GY771_02935 [bacterium]|nr:hypothetical protein [bacterium]
MSKYLLTFAVLITIIVLMGCDEHCPPLGYDPDDDYPPESSAPNDFRGSWDGKDVTLHWSESDNGTEIGYEIWRHNPDLGDYELIGETGAGVFEFVDNDLAGNSFYQYKAKCVFPGIEGEFTEAIIVFTGSLTLSCDGSAIIVNWDGLGSDAVNGYEVWRSVNDNSNYQLLGTTGSDERSYRDADVVLGETYYYKVRALYDTGEGCFCVEEYVFVTT